MACEPFHGFSFERSLPARGREPVERPAGSRLGMLAALGGDRRAACPLFDGPSLSTIS